MCEPAGTDRGLVVSVVVACRAQLCFLFAQHAVFLLVLSSSLFLEKPSLPPFQLWDFPEAEFTASSAGNVEAAKMLQSPGHSHTF